MLASTIVHKIMKEDGDLVQWRNVSFQFWSVLLHFLLACDWVNLVFKELEASDLKQTSLNRKPRESEELIKLAKKRFFNINHKKLTLPSARMLQQKKLIHTDSHESFIETLLQCNSLYSLKSSLSSRMRNGVIALRGRLCRMLDASRFYRSLYYFPCQEVCRWSPYLGHCLPRSWIFMQLKQKAKFQYKTNILRSIKLKTSTIVFIFFKKCLCDRIEICCSFFTPAIDSSLCCAKFSTVLPSIVVFFLSLSSSDWIFGEKITW